MTGPPPEPPTLGPTAQFIRREFPGFSPPGHAQSPEVPPPQVATVPLTGQLSIEKPRPLRLNTWREGLTDSETVHFRFLAYYEGHNTATAGGEVRGPVWGGATVASMGSHPPAAPRPPHPPLRPGLPAPHGGCPRTGPSLLWEDSSSLSAGCSHGDFTVSTSWARSRHRPARCVRRNRCPLTQTRRTGWPRIGAMASHTHLAGSRLPAQDLPGCSSLHGVEGGGDRSGWRGTTGLFFK